MRKLYLTCLITGITLMSANAQKLFTYGNHSVDKDEFLRIYRKNNQNKEADMSDTSLRSYLKLYSLFRMKVAEADKEKLDTLPNIQRELDNYRKTLAKNYLTDEQVTNKLVKEAYERMKQDVRVEHILIQCAPGSDTVAAYHKIDSIYQQVTTKKVDFEMMAKAFSEDRTSKDNGGDVGYFSALQIVYPFESAAYNTPVGKISKPFKTQFGYHIIKVLDKRNDIGQVKVAQIMLNVPKSRGDAAIEEARKKVDTIENLLKQGTPFHELVKKYSEDQYSLKDSGVLKPFGVGRMTPPFEKAAFALKKVGDVSEPVKTDYGYHVIKLLAKMPLEPYDSIFAQLKHKVENDSRAQSARDIFFNKIKDKNGFKEFPANIKEISDLLALIPDTGKNAKIVKAEDYKDKIKTVFTLGGKNYLQSDFAKFFETLTHGRVNGPRIPVIHDAYGLYVNNVVNDFEEHKLVEENPEFKNLMEEYRDGIMLFELMDRHVWGKASHDSEGLKTYYEAHKNKYLWEPGFEGSIYKFKNKAMYDTGMMMLAEKVNSDEQIVKRLNTQSNPDGVSIQRGRYEFSKFKDATQSELTQKDTKIIPATIPNGPSTVIVARKIYNTKDIKTLDEARGYVVAEYQDYLEKAWNEKMKNDYPMTINEKVFSDLKNSKAPKNTEKKKTSK